MFSKETEKISDFLTACRLYIMIRIRNVVVKEQVQWGLSYVQRELADIQKKNIIEDLESRNLNYATVGEFLSDLKEEFSRRDDKIIKDGRIKEDRARKQDNRRVLLQLQDLRVGQVKEPCIRVNIRELDRELYTKSSILYI